MKVVEWLIEKLDNNLDIKHSWRTKQYIDQAKEMEKQQNNYSEEEVYKMLLNYQSNYPYASNEIGLKKWFEEIKKK